jgi:lipopolysaccharide export system protein LptA
MRRARVIRGAILLASLGWLAAMPVAAQAPRGGATGGIPAPRRNEERQPVTVDADKMERFGKENLVVFSGNVVARQDHSVQYTDRMEVYLDERGDRILRTVSTGNVRIVTKECRMGTAQRAEYFEPQRLVRLLGNARVWQDDNVVSGETIDIYLSEDRSVVHGSPQGRVKAQFFPRDDARPAADGTPVAVKPQVPCQH